MLRPRLFVFASGSAEGGGSGFEKLVLASREGILDADIVGVASNHTDGGVREKADRLGVRFVPFRAPWTPESYQEIAEESEADYFPLSGWLKMVRGLDPRTRFNSRTVFNIHPGPVPRFGGIGMHGRHVHEAVIEAYRRGEVEASEVCMHFVDDEYDHGPVFFRLRIPIVAGANDNAETLGACVNGWEHTYQARITDLVVHGRIGWDGVNAASLWYPEGYEVERLAA